VKVWVFRGEIMEHDPTAFDRRMAETSGPSRPERGERGDRGERAGRGDAAA
jgi:small subunit ribosomal protein S3